MKINVGGVPLDEAKRQRASRRRSQPSGEGQTLNVEAKPRFKLVPWADFGKRPGPDEWLVDKLLPRVGLAVLFGKSKSFKSFIALDIAVAVASDRPWAGRRVTTGIVVYIVCEGQSGFAKRIAAYRAMHVELATLDVYIVTTRPDMGARPGDLAELVGSIRGALGEASPVLIIVDTLVRTLNGRDENGEGMRNFSDNAEDLADAFRCLVIAVHHRGAGEGSPRARGSTVLPGASVATWHVERVLNGGGDTARVEVMEAKDTASGQVFEVHLQSVEFGDEHDVERDSTLIVQSVEAIDSAPTVQTTQQGNGPKRRRAPSGKLKALFTSIDIALERSGVEMQLPDNGPKVRMVNRDTVRTVYIGKRADLEPGDAKRTFNRYVAQCLDAESVLSREVSGAAMLFFPAK